MLPPLSWKYIPTKGIEIHFLHVFALLKNVFPTLQKTRACIHDRKHFPAISDVGGQHSYLLSLGTLLPEYMTCQFGTYQEQYLEQRFTGGH